MSSHAPRTAALLLVAPLWFGMCTARLAAAERLVSTPNEYAAATASLKPGDTVLLADGEWRDFQMVLVGRGSAAQPITLTAQTPGKVVLTGQSNLRIAGEHLLVSNLVFRDGHSPTGEVLSFRVSPSQRASHSRMTGMVVDRFNQPDRSRSDNWVAMYGQSNRFDHGQLVGKHNAGPTMVVVRDPVQGLDNRHRIDHNWFGPRPNLGANGGETLRVGTSHHAGSDAHVLVERNWFEGCDGEVEVVSSKSGGNTYRGNVFKQSSGALVLRHGDGNLVEGNVFLGEGKRGTGGVRLVGRQQVVRNNYFEGLTGDGFVAALAIMQGVPDSPANRYVQVDDARIERNTFVDVRHLQFNAGKDAERSAAPVDSHFTDNLVVGRDDPLREDGDIAGITFSGNVQDPVASPLSPGGIRGAHVAMRRAATGLMVASDAAGAGADPALTFVPRNEVGVAWYPKHMTDAAADGGRSVRVLPGDGTLSRAVADAAPGDRLQLLAGDYRVDTVLALDHPLAVEGPATGKATITFSRETLFQLDAGGALRLARLQVDGRAAPDAVGNAVVRTTPGSGAANYTLLIEDSRIHGLDGNRGFDVIALGKGTLADRVTLRRVVVEDASGNVLSARAETDDRGTYNAERVEIVDSTFLRIGGAVVDLYRGGGDESTSGPTLAISGSRLDRVGRDGGPSLRLHGVQHATLRDNQFIDSTAPVARRTSGTPRLIAIGNTFLRSPALQSDYPVEPRDDP